MKKYLSIVLFMILLLSACTAQDNSLVGNWRLTSYGPEGSLNPAVADSNAELTFNEDGTVNGNSGCNGFGGEYTVEGDQITFSELFSTLMACEEPLMSQEGAVFQVLNGGASFTIDGETLTITNGEAVLVFTSSQ